MPASTFSSLACATLDEDPFADADIVLRSHDGQKFRVHEQVIAHASPVLATLISCASSTTSHARTEESPGLTLPYPGLIIDRFLRFIYPSPEPMLKLDDIASILEIAERYQVRSVTRRMGRILLSPEYLQVDSAKVYALASYAGLTEVTRIAAMRTLARPLDAQQLAQMRLLSGAALHRLLQYRMECSMAAADIVRAVTEVPRWVPLQWRRFCFLSECGECVHAGRQRSMLWHRTVHGRVDVPMYWVNYMDGVRAALQEKLDPNVARDQTLVSTAVDEGLQCSRCATKICWDMEEFAESLKEAIDEAIASVKFSPDDHDDESSDTQSEYESPKQRYYLPGYDMRWPLHERFQELYRRGLLQDLGDADTPLDHDEDLFEGRSSNSMSSE
ncbi:hypothetical protein C8Q77DRAFT_1156842 [Trametes polyzona]|nr:hypothetical protein C8Q77DRAFT_1156842 [Trametes polyzona]